MSAFARRFLWPLAAALTCVVAGCSQQKGPQPAPEPVHLPSPGQNNGTNVVIILLDTVRADKMTCYGNDAPTTPFIDQLAAHGLRFERCMANASWTLPSHATLFTGTYVVAHQATQETLHLGDELPTLAEIYDAAGYDTFGCSTNAILSESSGLTRGFTTFFETFRDSVADELQSPGLHVNNVALARWLSSRSSTRPFFAFLNYVEAHLPYAPIEPFASAFVDSTIPAAQVAAARRLRMRDHYLRPGGLSEAELHILGELYEGEIAMLDQQVGLLLKMLAESGNLDHTLVVLTADHGENLGDRGQFGHVFDVGNSLLHVPLILFWPDGGHAGEVRSDLVQLVDLFPTLLRQCDVPFEGRFDGRDLLAPGAASQKVPALAEYYYPRQVLSVFRPEELQANLDRFLPYMRRLRAIQDDHYKLVWASSGASRLYAIDDDPGELHDLLADGGKKDVAKRLEHELARMVEEHRGPVPLSEPPPPGWLLPGFEGNPTDPELLEKLRALGYVN